MKVAFCTNSLKEVDEHFGRSHQMAIYNVKPEGYEFVEVREMGAVDSAQDAHASSIERKVQRIKDCAIVYMTEIGGPAAATVVRSKIHPVKVPAPQPIEDILASLQKVLAGSPPPWLRKIMQQEG
ncbi:nitrogen fixation protein NifX [Desulfurispirillum indicum S5]|uniref:Nitrogen fixation protein NifX n=1 Tax=Desulfurispirillum indicum (strain ATCC BAA-1389 / DSM 22839 / S5) TaxID=653733 RepID=E6W6M0_DESIS|nr:nitrogen fixation protein NifX [Desulfurispirillum indicum]ADU65020.1 nitrogen fixation protein NifX [Desulfurispirillum indicum S5]